MRTKNLFFITLLLTIFLAGSVSFPKIRFPKMQKNKKPSSSSSSKKTNDSKSTSLNLFGKIGITAASAVSAYWAITSIFFPGLTSNVVQFETVEDIPAVYFKEKRDIPAFVVKVTDGDTYRVRHLVGKNSREFKGSLRDHTIPIRIAAIDTPEVAKNGQPGQKYGEEAKQFAIEKILRKDITVKLLGKDQYNRAIGLVKYTSEGKEYNLAEELLKNGLAVVYRQGGAKYDGTIEKWNEIENKAKLQRKGIWKDGIANVELPSEYKRAIRAAAGSKQRSS